MIDGKELALLVLGALLGTATSAALPVLVAVVRRRRRETSRTRWQTNMSSTACHDPLVAYYRERGHAGDLYTCRIGDYEERIPFLTSASWTAVRPFDRSLFTMTPGPSVFDTDRDMVRRRRALGQKLFDAPTVYVDRISERDSMPQLHLQSCQYFEMLTLLGHLEEETLGYVRSKGRSSTPLRDMYWPSLDTARTLRARPVSLGCHVVLALQHDGGFSFLMQERSNETITYGGAVSSIPVYGVSPVPGEAAPPDLLRYNLLKEYGEELFDYEELIDEMARKGVDARWFYSLPEVAELLEALDDRSVTAHTLGMGFDALNGSFSIAVLCVVRNESLVARVLRSANANWEVAERSVTSVPLQVVPTDSPQLESWLREHRFQFPSAYCIAEAIRFLENEQAPH